MDCRVHVKGKLRSCRFGPEADGQHGGFRTRLCSIYLCEEVMHSRPWLARLAAMPEVLPVQFMQTSTCRSFATISSGLYRFLAITVLLDVKDIPQVGPLQWG